LIDQFLTGQKENSESAFETLLKRHGPMVLGVCRHVLRRDQDAEDAFQATFLVLARKAGTIHNREILGCWLHEVAYRTAIRARERHARSTPRMEIQEVEESHSGPENAASRDELRLLLRAEVDGLPGKYRSLVLHTYYGRQEQRAGRQAAWMSGRHSQGAAVAGPRPAASTAEPARLGPRRGPISMGMIRPAGTPGEWSAEIESVFSAPDPSDPVFSVYLNMTL
jgi:RNA polymerase sigma factor (sigma-70 family)